MSVIKSGNVSWNNIKVDQYTDITTGYTYITLPGQTTKLADSSNADWTILDLNLLTRTYNNANISALTTEEVKSLFFRDGRFVFNKVREDVINDVNNYSNTSEFELYTLGMFNNGVPGAVNPKDGRRVNDDGKKTEFNVFSRIIPTVSTFQTRTSGTPFTPSSFQGPNDVQLSSTGNENTYKRSSSFGTLRYPANVIDGMDYITFQAFEYSSSGGLLEGGRGASGTGIGGGVQLPIQPTASESSGVSWGQDKINYVQASAGQAVLNGLDTALATDGNLLEKIGAAGKSTASSLLNSTTTALNDANSIPFIKAYFAGQAVGANVVTRATGGIINPNLELLFTGPKLREFSFNFTMTPRDEGESQSIKEIIKYFKKNMAPKKSNNGLFLYTPNVFKISYIYNGGGEHPFMNRFKTCALINCGVNYTPHGSYTTYDDGSMTQYSLQLSFSEILPIYQDDQDGVGGTGY